MTAPVLTSAKFDVWRALERMMGEVAFPALDANRDGVMTYFGDPDTAPAKSTDGKPLKLTPERVVVVSMVEAPGIEWGPAGRGAQNERFMAYIAVRTAVPGRSEGKVRDRLEALCAAVVLKLRETTDPALDPVAREVPEFAKYGRAVMALNDVLPLIAASPNGIAGTAAIEIRCDFRIGTPAKETA